MIILLNFSHPLTEEQRLQVIELLGEELDVRDLLPQVDRGRPIMDVTAEIVDAVGLDSTAWQTHRFVTNPPGLASLALALIAEIHGRCGYFPPILNVRPVEGALPPRFEVAEIVNLQVLRDVARGRRHDP